MSDRSYWIVRAICAPAFHISSRPLVLHRERAARDAGYILALNHNSYFDVPCLFVISPRCLDFQSVELFQRNLFVRLIFGCMNTFYVDRSRKDVRIGKLMVDRLRAGRVIALFPERGIRRGAQSVLVGGEIRSGTARLARLARAPILPAAVVGTHAYHKIGGWLPIRRTRYAVAFGEAIKVRDDMGDDAVACDHAERQLAESFRSLYREIAHAAPQITLR